MIAMETGKYLTTPALEGAPGLPPEAQFRFRYLEGDKIEVHHPFHSVTVLGDGSNFETKYLDAAAVVLFTKLPYLLDTRKLSRPDHLATRPLAGRLSELGSSFSLAMMAKDMGGGPIDVIDALWNDAGKLYSAHQGDDNYFGHGNDDGHDVERPDFFRRAGIIDAFIEAEILRPKGNTMYVGDTRLTIDTLLSEDEATVRASFVSNKHPARRMDADRFQYNEEERLLMNLAANLGKTDPFKLPRALASLALDNIARRVVTENGEGDQLIFIDKEAARLSSIDYVRHNSEHWCEPVQDLVSDLLNLTERYLFLCDHPLAEAYQYFYPQDYLHTSSTMMHELFAKIARDDPAMRWFLETATKLAEHQRGLALTYDTGENRYSGPKPPEWVHLELIDKDSRQEPTVTMQDRMFNIVLPKGKIRTVDPRVQIGNTTVPLSELDERFAQFRDEQHQWIGNYKASIEIQNPEVAQAVGEALKKIQDNWSNVLKTRPQMPDSVLRESIAEANAFVLNRGILQQ